MAIHAPLLCADGSNCFFLHLVNKVHFKMISTVAKSFEGGFLVRNLKDDIDSGYLFWGAVVVPGYSVLLIYTFKHSIDLHKQ